MGKKKQLVHVFIKASVSELKIHSALVAGRYRKLLRQISKLKHAVSFCSMFIIIDIPQKLRLVNIDLSSLLLHLQIFNDQLTFENT